MADGGAFSEELEVDHGVAVDIGELRKQADEGSCVAQTVLGIFCLEGFEVPCDYVEAFRLLSAAVGRGVPRAATALGRMYAEGLGTKKDLARAIRLYEQAGEHGEFDAQIALGRIYSQGYGIEPDFQAARRWYSAALSQADTVLSCPELDEAKLFLGR